VSEESYFFRLSAYQDQLLEFYNKNPDFITPKERLNEIISFVKSGLRDLSISRKSVSWGIPFPGDPSHTIYVWADALNNYISAIGYGQQKTAEDEQFAFWWPADVQTMAKDIVRFHAIYWPAFLLAAGLELPKKLLAHGYILVGDRKMSKSLGNTIDPEQLAQWYGVDQVRYYLMRHFSIAQDGQFDLKDIEEHITADLANGVGNLLSRTVALALNNKCERISPPVLLEPASEALREKCKETFKFYWEEMNKCSFHLALSELWKFISLVNAHFHTMQPWVLAKTNHELFLETLSVTCHSLYAIGHMLWPVMPDKMEVLLNTIGTPLNKNINHEPGLRESIWNKDFNLKPVDAPLFIRPPVLYSQENQGTQETGETKKVKQEKKQEKHEPQELQTITIDTFAQVGLYVGTVLSCEKVPGSDKLYKLMVDFGPLGQRQILSGVAQALTPDQLINKQGIFVVNLAPRTLMGLESQGMMLFAHDKQGVWQIATVSGSVQNGTRIG
jgi:methionyl-tRNA synthetase